MSAYFLSGLWLFVAGAVGATMFLFIALLFDKEIAILDNNVITSRGVMALIYVSFGGLLAAILSISKETQFEPEQLRVAFAAGLGWPAVATGIGAGKQIGDLNRSKEEIREILEKEAERQVEQIREFFVEKLAATGR